MRNLGLIVKVVILFGLSIVFAVALVIISNVVNERERYRDRVVDDVGRSTARAQTVTGPVLVWEYERRIRPTSGNGAEQRIPRQEVLLPESLEIVSRVTVEKRHRGIYEARVYRSTNRLRGRFRIPPRFGLPGGEEIASGRPARVVVGISDARGVRRAPRLLWGGHEIVIEPGTRLAWLEQGFSADVEAQTPSEERVVPFEIELDLLGTDRLGVLPVGARTEAEMTSDWPHPSFEGGFLPDERTIGSKGFRATWRLSRFATGIDPAMLQSNPSRGQPVVERRPLSLGADGRELAVKFVQPVDVYQQSQRAVKYGMLFVLLTFLAFFLYEVLRRLAVHPIQYALAGAALALFFLLLVSLSEHLPFAIAYVVSSAACAGLLAFYVGHVLHSVARGLGFGAMLAVLYGVLYVLLLSEDYALLLGTLLLFVVLAGVMIATRHVDWYRLGESSEGESSGF